MDKQNQNVAVNVESEQAPKAGYTAPEMFAVAPTVELIQGGNGIYNYDSVLSGTYSNIKPPPY